MSDASDATADVAMVSPNYESFLAAPIIPPGLGAGLDIYGGATGDGSEGWNPSDPSAFSYDSSVDIPGKTITFAQVEALLGRPTQNYPDGGTDFAGAPPGATWGPTQEVAVLYDANHAISDLWLSTGYAGTLTFKSADGSIAYTLSINGSPIQQSTNGGASTPLILDWSNTPNLIAQASTLYDALRATFRPSFPSVTNCNNATATADAGDASTTRPACIIGDDQASGGYLWFPGLELTFYVNTTIGTPTENSAPVLVDLTNPAAE
jgi:hypothetical protein